MQQERAREGISLPQPREIEVTVNIVIDAETPLYYANVYSAGGSGHDVSVALAHLVGPRPSGEGEVKVKASCAVTVSKSVAKQLAADLARLADRGEEKT